jgi:hypothetical protein
VEEVSKTQQRALTAVGAVLGLVLGFLVFQKVIGNRMIEAPRFVLAVFLGGIVGMAVYTLIKDGIPFVLKRQKSTDAPVATTPPPPAPRPAPRVAKRAAPSEDAPARPLRAERPLKPRER